MNNIESYLISYSSPLLQILGSASLLSFPEFYSGYSRTDQLLKRAAGEGANFRYGFFSERKSYFEEMGKFNFKPKISKIYSFEDAPLALESMVSENHFGKVVVTVTS